MTQEEDAHVYSITGTLFHVQGRICRLAEQQDSLRSVERVPVDAMDEHGVALWLCKHRKHACNLLFAVLQKHEIELRIPQSFGISYFLRDHLLRAPEGQYPANCLQLSFSRD